MPSFSVGFAQVEDRLRIVRRRLNLLTLQDALYLSGSLVALASRPRGRRRHCAAAPRSSPSRCGPRPPPSPPRSSPRRCASAGAGCRSNRWCTSPTARPRSTTASPPSSPTRPAPARRASRTSCCEQILTAAPRWDVDTLAPRRVPRSVFVLAAALAALIATSFFARPPATPQPASAMRQPPSRADADGGVLQPRTANAARRMLPAIRGAGAADGGRGAARCRHRARASRFVDVAATRPAPTPAPAQPGKERNTRSRASKGRRRRELVGFLRRARAGRHGQATAGCHSSRARGRGVGSDAARRRRNGPTPRTARQADASAKRGARSERSGTDPPKSARRGTDPLNSARSDTDPLHKDASSTGLSRRMRRTHAPGAGSAATAGARAGQAPGELFGSASGARLGGTASESLSIKLGAFAAMAPSQVEPQRQTPPVGDLAVSRAGRHSRCPLWPTSRSPMPRCRRPTSPRSMRRWCAASSPATNERPPAARPARVGSATGAARGPRRVPPRRAPPAARRPRRAAATASAWIRARRARRWRISATPSRASAPSSARSSSGRADVIEEILIALFAGGHVLIEGVPGTGKTLIVRTLGAGART